MGINKLPEIRDYWSTDDYLHYSPIADRITRDRFEQITWFFLFADNDTLPARGEEGFSRLQKVDPIISALKQNFQAAYYLHCQVSIDEAMIPFKGRSFMKQYVPLKPVKLGFKVWAMANALNRYVYDFNVYTGAGESGEREKGLGEEVLTLAESIKGRHHHLYFDNYFSSITLLSKLLEEGTYAFGTIRTNHKEYPSDETKQFDRGQSSFCQCGNLVATAWKDNKVVNVVSTLASPTDTTSVNRRQKDGT